MQPGHIESGPGSQGGRHTASGQLLCVVSNSGQGDYTTNQVQAYTLQLSSLE
jgi:hypothetical protein